MTDATSRPDALLLLEHRQWIRALARRLLADENDVDDVEQQTWMAAMRAGPDEPRATRSWLGVVASRLALQRLRRRGRAERLEAAAAAAERVERSPSDVVADADAHGRVVQAVLALDEPYRTTILLRYFEGLAVADVARRTGVPLETTRTRLRRAHEQLRKELDDERDGGFALLLAPLAGTAAPRAAPVGGVPTTAVPFGLVAASVGGVVGVAALGAWIIDRGSQETGGAETAVVAPPHDDVARGAGRADDDAAGKPRPPGTDEAGKQDAPPQPSPSDAPTLPARDAWTAFDLADGKPLADFALRVTTAAGERTTTTDAAGRIAVERASVLDVAPAAADVWTFARPTKGAVKDEASLWFWRERVVSGTVRSADPEKPLGAVTFAWIAPWGEGAQDAPGVGVRWLMTHGFDRTEKTLGVRADADGRVSGTAPAPRGGMLVALADGFGPDAAPLVWNAAGECVVTFELHPTIRVVGRVLDESGGPAAGVQVALESSVEVATETEYSRLHSALRAARQSFIAGGTPGGWHVTAMRAATTDVRGIFEFRTPSVGTGVVALFRPGCLVCREDLGPLTKDVAPFVMRLAPSNVRVTFRDAGVPIADASVGLQVADGRENGFSLATDAEGRADGGWLQRGRWYVTLSPSRKAFFRWDGQEALDLSQLPKEPSKDK